MLVLLPFEVSRLQDTFQRMRLIHGAFVVSWFLFILVLKFAVPPQSPGNIPGFLPLVFGFVCVSEVGLAFFLREQIVTSAEAVLKSDPENSTALAKWRTGNLLSFCFAETITLFGLALKLLGFEWRVAAIFFAAGLLFLLLWMPRKIEAMHRGVR